MYPLDTKAPWPLNQWYIAAFGEEIVDRIIPRTILGERIVLFRDSAGEAHALSGVCPHRMMPMELGSVQDDRLVCGYHGLAFDLSGQCAASPTAGTPPNCALRVFPVLEAGPLIWIWPGDPALAAQTPLPDQASIGIGAEGWETDCVQRLDLEARAQILIDNLFDLSHFGFVHASILGSGGIALVEPQIEDRDGRLIVARTYADAPTDPYHRFLHPGIGDRMTVRVETELLGVGLINAGGPAWNGASTDAPRLGQMNFIHGITPATPTTCHYWSILTRDFRIGDQALTGALIAQNKAVLNQDVEVLEAIEALLGSGCPLPAEISMKPDAGALRARLRMIQMIRNDEPADADRGGATARLEMQHAV